VKTDLPERMRQAADAVAEANALYGYNPEHGVWSPAALRKEAAVVESEVPQ
jgi:hypothetical protein